MFAGSQRSLLVVVFDVAVGRNGVSEVEVVTADDLDAGKVLADRLAELGVVGRGGAGIGVDEVACGVAGRRSSRGLPRRGGSGDGRRTVGLVQSESFAVIG